MKLSRIALVLACVALWVTPATAQVRDITTINARNTAGTLLGKVYFGTSTPEGAQTAPVGYFFFRMDTGQVYRKASGSGNTGWVDISSASGFSGTLACGNGGTGLTSGTSGGVLAFTGACTIASSGLLATNAVVLGGGSGAAPATSTLTATVVKAASGVLSAATAGTDYVSPSSTESLTNKTLDAEGTGNVVTIPFVFQFPVAICQNTTASLALSTPTTNPAVAACVTGSNTQLAVAQFADGANALSMQGHLSLPTDWSGNIDVKGKWRTSATSGDVVWQVATICVADAETVDPSFNTASTVTDTAKGTTNQLNDFSLSSITVTGCAAGEEMFWKFTRDPANGSDSLAATAEVVGNLTFILRRAI